MDNKAINTVVCFIFRREIYSFNNIKTKPVHFVALHQIEYNITGNFMIVGNA